MRRILRVVLRLLKVAWPWIIAGVVLCGAGRLIASDIQVHIGIALLCLFVGGTLGTICASLCAAAGRADDHLMYRELSPETGKKIEEALEEEPLGVGAAG